MSVVTISLLNLSLTFLLQVMAATAAATGGGAGGRAGGGRMAAGGTAGAVQQVMSSAGVTVSLSELNPHFVCVLCFGYFVDATTITECMHTCKLTCGVTCVYHFMPHSFYLPNLPVNFVRYLSLLICLFSVLNNSSLHLHLTNNNNNSNNSKNIDNNNNKGHCCLFVRLFHLQVMYLNFIN